MKGLMFNLLESLAQDAGCSDEAWELVSEFAAAETLAEGLVVSRERPWGSDVRPPDVFEVPAEAMLSCLIQGQGAHQSLIPERGRDSWLQLESLSSLPVSASLPATAVSGFGPNAFALRDEADFDALDDDDFDEDFDDDEPDWDIAEAYAKLGLGSEPDRS